MHELISHNMPNTKIVSMRFTKC